ncbi:MAG: putative quinol monooxygenase [Thermoguttaceae bacterium]
MFVVLVYVHVIPEFAEDFKQASLANAAESVKEPLCDGFEVLQQNDDPTRFVLIETYKSEAGFAAHKETAHYEKWRVTVEPWMSEPRKGVKHTSY